MAGIPGDGWPVRIARPRGRGDGGGVRHPAPRGGKALAVAILAAVAFAVLGASAGGGAGTAPDGGAGAPAGAIRGTVTAISDGDTLEIDGTRVRLALVDAPDAAHNGKWAAYETAAETCPVGSEAAYDPDDGQPGGSYGRVLAEVWCGGVSLNQALVDAGQARIVHRFCGASEFSGSPWAAGECGPR